MNISEEQLRRIVQEKLGELLESKVKGKPPGEAGEKKKRAPRDRPKQEMGDFPVKGKETTAVAEAQDDLEEQEKSLTEIDPNPSPQHDKDQFNSGPFNEHRQAFDKWREYTKKDG